MEKQLEEYLHTHIPLTKAMGVTVSVASSERVLLTASFAKNINHKKTVFGGSLHSLATLACWSLIHVNLNHSPHQIVIAKSEIDYLLPVDSDFTVECKMPKDGSWQKFLHMLNTKNRSRIHLTASIHHQGKLAVTYRGTFAVL